MQKIREILYGIGIHNELPRGSSFLEQFNNKIKDLSEITAEDFNKIWDETYDDFKKKYNLELM